MVAASCALASWPAWAAAAASLVPARSLARNLGKRPNTSHGLRLVAHRKSTEIQNNHHVIKLLRQSRSNRQRQDDLQMAARRSNELQHPILVLFRPGADIYR